MNKYVLICAVACVLPSCKSQKASHSTPKIIDVLQSEVTITWRTMAAVSGQLRYQKIGSELPIQEINSPLGRKHQVQIKGLQSSTRYNFWLGQDSYQFQTQPLPTEPFSFLLVWGKRAVNK